MKVAKSTRRRGRHSAELKTKLVLAVLREDQTQNQLASAFGIHPLQITPWKKVTLESLPEIFGAQRARTAAEQEELERQLYARIGRLETELAWLKKQLGPLA